MEGRSGRLKKLSRKTLVWIYKTTRSMCQLLSERSVLLLRGQVSRERSGPTQCQKGFCRGNYSAASLAKNNSSNGVCEDQVNVTVSWPNFIRDNHYLPPSKPLWSIFSAVFTFQLSSGNWTHVWHFHFKGRLPSVKEEGILPIKA